MRVHPIIHFFWKNAIRCGLALIFLGIPATLLYLREVGIGFGAKEALALALSQNTLGVSIGRLAFDPFSGLLIEGVAIRDRAQGGRLIAKISDISLSLNLSALSHGKIVVDKLFLKDAAVSIPVGAAKDAPRLDLMKVHAEIILLGDHFRLSRLDGVVEGIGVNFTGDFFNIQSLKITSNTAPSSGSDVVKKILNELSKLHYPEESPILSGTIEADCSDLSSLHISELSLKAGEIHSEEWLLKSLEIQGDFAEGILRVQRFSAADFTGSLEASVVWSRESGVIEGTLLSTLNPIPFLPDAVKNSETFRSLDFVRSPEFDVEFTLGTHSPSMSIMGSLAAPEVLFRGVTFHDSGCQFSWKDGALYVRDVRTEVQKGTLSGQFWMAPDDCRIQLNTTIPPTALLGLFDPKTREFLSQMEFEELPDISLFLYGTQLSLSALHGHGHLKIGRTAMRGSWLDGAEADFEIGKQCVTYKNFLILGGGGRATGTFAYDVGLQEVRLNDIRATLVPYSILMWIDPKIAEAVKPYRFRAPPSTIVNGKAHLKDATKNGLTIAIESSAGLDYDLLHRTLKFGKTSAQVDVIGTKVHANIHRAELMGGDVALQAIVSIDPKDPTFSADAEFRRINFAKLTELYFDYDDSKGLMSGNYKFSARAGEENLMHGAGSIRVEDGNVFAIPVLGPFSEILKTVLPGVAYHTARTATADFTVANETIHSDDLLIEGSGFQMQGAGDIFFMTSRLNMSMRINIRGVPGIVFYPVSKLFEYVSTGTVAQPDWRPKMIPRLPQAQIPLLPLRKTGR